MKTQVKKRNQLVSNDIVEVTTTHVHVYMHMYNYCELFIGYV